MAASAYGPERLERLLRLLTPAPQRWIEKAHETLAQLLARDARPAESISLTAADVAELQRAIELDPVFRAAFDVDPVAAAEGAGRTELARALERELRGLVAVAERFTADEAYRGNLLADPVGTLQESDVAVSAAEPLLRTLSLSDDVLARLPEVVAHHHGEDATRAHLVLLLLESSAAVEALRDAARRAG